MSNHNSIWWGPPRKFATRLEERKISWLELFYDLVYVIVISRITHHLAGHPGWEGLMDYIYLFTMTFWGWYNGSQYYDLHGTPGIRTRLMTLWQMMAVAALAVTLASPPETLLFRATISILVLQFYITYLWWSVGIYDKNHRRLNLPYTICFLIAFGLVCCTLFVPQPYKRILAWIALILNYLPPFLTASTWKERAAEFQFSSSMMERLGLLAIIVFGEAILGVINGLGEHLDLHLWVCFGLGILIAFALWWIFFSLIADRESKKGILIASTIALLYIPTLASLGMIGAAFPGLMGDIHQDTGDQTGLSRIIYGLSIAVFLCAISTISRFLVYPQEYYRSKRLLQPLLVAVGLLNLILIAGFPTLSIITYLSCVFLSLLLIIVVITRGWFRVELNRLEQDGEVS